MKINELRELAGLMEECGISELEVTEDGRTVKLKRQEPACGRTDASAGEKRNPITEPRRKDGTEVTAPLVGVFYASPSPDAKPFVTVGSHVRRGDVLCIVEAMKLMNEITAERDGTVLEVCAENGQVVDFGQTLFVLG
ncbi:MAG: acetyl-CoA carboxylase biotin carboxyl carrier protein [Oscillospiraceae bacterium]|nr:acetyl-CoA carboxylase biotin carboxyl carrier protein [Oscillospiraceae bacterium]